MAVNCHIVYLLRCGNIFRHTTREEEEEENH
jgi:hypothetical protein